MESKLSIHLKTEDALTLFKIYTGKYKKRSLFNAAMYKLFMLFQRAEKRDAYAYIQLLQIKASLSKLLQGLDEAIQKFEALIATKHCEVSEFEFSTKKHLQFRFKNPIVYRLGLILKRFDQLCCLVILARRLNAFNKNRAFFKIKQKYKTRLWQTLTKLVTIKTRNVKLITIEDYLNNTENYQKNFEYFGKIEPHMLYNAVNLSDIPFLGVDEMERIGVELKIRNKYA